MRPPITTFAGKRAFLSNFHIAPVVLNNEVYPSVEHAYQAAKFPRTKGRGSARPRSSPGRPRGWAEAKEDRTGGSTTWS